ncbi:MAG: hypothetical protein CMM32_06860 [Rhodospirillaceae bacterium]|nr:hypothetical protein [Rhodospirillaceae bacterium]|tara:strand:+ start:829 stop:1599 length:771 start_codon:yes stop_codon:yes gene_type:complete
MTTRHNYFDGEAESYPLEVGSTYTQARKWQLVKENLPKKGLVMDVGSASGRHALKITSNQITVLAIDPSYEMTRKLMQKTQGQMIRESVIPCAAALPHLPFTQRAFDTIYCFSTLLLLPKAKQRESLVNMAKLLKNEGTLIVDVANSWSLGIHYWNKYYRKKGFSGIFGYKKRELCRIFSELGLQIELMESHGLLTQLLLLPGLDRSHILGHALRGNSKKKGWDAAASSIIPFLAERWYIVARFPRNIDANVAHTP